MADSLRLLELPPELLGLVARALLCDDPQADAQAVGRLAASSKALRDLVRGNDVVVAELQAARKMLTHQRRHEILVAKGRLGADAAFPLDPSNYKQVAQQLPAPATTLNLGGPQWRVAAEERGRLVARLLRVSGSMTELRLSGNQIGGAGAKTIAEALVSSGSLVRLLDLGNNPIGDEGAKALAEAVRVSGSLATLVLHGCGIGDEGAKALAASVAASSSMATLYLGDNGIGDEGAKALAEAIRSSGSLRFIQMHNNISNAAMKSLRDAVQGRHGFQLLIV